MARAGSPTRQVASDSSTGSVPFAPPERLTARRRRFHVVVLGIIALLGLVRGSYWAVTTEVWSPIDEAQHFGYVESLATGDGVPTVGVDVLSDDLLYSIKSSPQSGLAYLPFLPTGTDPGWGASAQQYEGIHGPTYYALVAPAYWLGRPFGFTSAILSVRLATVIVMLAAVPLTWALARRLFPTRPAVWLLAPGLLVLWNGLNQASVNNDALVVPLAAATGLAALRALERPESGGLALVAGLVMGLTVVTKTTTLAVMPMMALMGLWWVIQMRPGAKRALRVAGIVALGGAVALVPWLLWNFHAHGGPSASAQVDQITGVLFDPAGITPTTVRTHLADARNNGFWQNQLLLPFRYVELWETITILTVGIGLVVALVRRRLTDALALAWSASAWLLAFLAMEAIVFGVFGGRGGPVGRHLWVALPYLAIAIVAGTAQFVSARFLPAAMAVLAILSVSSERELVAPYLGTRYVSAFVGPYGPVVNQVWSDTRSAPGEVLIDAGCEVGAVGLRLFVEEPPSRLDIRTGTTGVENELVGIVGGLTTYRLDRTVAGPLVVDVPVEFSSAGEDREPRFSLVDGDGDPVMRVYCTVDDVREQSFDVMYDPQHPSFVTLGLLERAPKVWVPVAWLAVISALVIPVWMDRDRLRAGVDRLRSKRD